MSNASVPCTRIMVLCAILLIAGCTQATQVVRYAKTYAVDGRVMVHVHAFDARVHVETSTDPTVAFHVQCPLS